MISLTLSKLSRINANLPCCQCTSSHDDLYILHISDTVYNRPMLIEGIIRLYHDGKGPLTAIYAITIRVHYHAIKLTQFIRSFCQCSSNTVTSYWVRWSFKLQAYRLFAQPFCQTQTAENITGLCEGNSPVTVEFPVQNASNAENDFICWRHHAFVDRTPVHEMRP